MNKSARYHKSAKGTEAIAHRTHSLGPKLRSMLILIDGKRSFEELTRISFQLGDASQLLEQLLADGFIEEVAGPGAPDATAAAAAAPTVPDALPAAPPVTLQEARRFASRRLTDLLGPTAETLCQRIEAAKNVAEFDAALVHAQEILQGFSHQKAALFADEIRRHRPHG